MVYLLNKLVYWHNFIIYFWCFLRSSQADDTSLDECLPQLADRCFEKLITNINCRGTTSCDDYNALCELFDDSLQCSVDIIDGDCSNTVGRKRFDFWYKGLRAVYSYLCLPMNTNRKQEYFLPDFRNSMCWNQKKFVNCVGQMLNIHHVVDILNTSFDSNECIRVLIAMTSCNVNSQITPCSDYHEALVNNLIYIFFSQHKCSDFDIKTNGAAFSLAANFLPIVFVGLIFLNK